MREIKFRAWNGHNMELPIYDVSTQYGNKKLMQYTGLKDRHGVEIYEGDLVEGWIPDTNKDTYNFKGQVTWEDDGFAVCNLSGGYVSDLATCSFNHSLAVIGNIYENKDLQDANQ